MTKDRTSDIGNLTILFVTGRLAELGIRETVAELSQRLGFRYEIVLEYSYGFARIKTHSPHFDMRQVTPHTTLSR